MNKSEVSASVKFRDLPAGATFDFVGLNPATNSFFHRCTKISKRKYSWSAMFHPEAVSKIGTIDCEVFHVER